MFGGPALSGMMSSLGFGASSLYGRVGYYRPGGPTSATSPWKQESKSGFKNMGLWIGEEVNVVRALLLVGLFSWYVFR